MKKVNFGSTTIPYPVAGPAAGDDYATRNMAHPCVVTPASPGKETKGSTDVAWEPNTSRGFRPTARNKAPEKPPAGMSLDFGGLFSRLG